MLFEACKYVFWESYVLGIVETVGKPVLLELGRACETWSLGTDSVKLYSA